MSQDCTESLQQQISTAIKNRQPLKICGGNSKAFIGRPTQGQPLEVAGHSGVISYETKELVITARCGTPLSLIEEKLNQQGQMLSFEPPHFGATATLGGTIACGLSGPRRPFAGSARDYVLGVRLINGRGEVLRFGGEVIKNVAGYDLSRLLTGAMGTLGLMLDISLRVVPKPEQAITLVHQLPMDDALKKMLNLRRASSPLSAAAYADGTLYIRLAGVDSTVSHYATQIGWDSLPEGDLFWRQLKEQQHPFFSGDLPLWRLSLPPTAPMPQLEGQWLIDWAGGLRWLRSQQPADIIFAASKTLGGHAQCFRNGDRDRFYQPLNPLVDAFHQQLKIAFDPNRIFNPGRMYADL